MNCAKSNCFPQIFSFFNFLIIDISFPDMMDQEPGHSHKIIGLLSKIQYSQCGLDMTFVPPQSWSFSALQPESHTNLL